MPERFDPYYQWLGITPAEQPPNHYRLLGVVLFEDNAAVLQNAADQRMAHLRTFQSGKHSDESQKLLNEVAAARVCLLNSAKKAAYDETLRQQMEQPAGADATAPLDPEVAGLLDKLDQAAPTPAAGTSSPARRIAWIAGGVLAAVVVLVIALWLSQDRGRPTEVVVSAASPVQPHEDSKVLPGNKQESPAKNTVAASPAPPPPPPLEQSAAKPQKETKPAPPPQPVREPAPQKAAQEPPAEKRAEEEKVAQVKIAPPSSERQQQLIATLDEVYKPAEAKDRAAKVELARKLLEEGRSRDSDRAEQFVLFRRAGEIARDTCEPDLMLEAVDAMTAAGFNIRPFTVKARLLRDLLKQCSSSAEGDVSAVIAGCMKFAEAAQAADCLDEAASVLDAAHDGLVEPRKRAQQAYRSERTAATRMRNPGDRAAKEQSAREAQGKLEALEAAQSALGEFIKDFEQFRRDREAVRAAQERLASAPDDPEACLAVGRWLCFCRGDWDAGLKLLAQGSDASLQSAARKDMALASQQPDDCIACGDAWWDLAEKASGKAKTAMRRRAAHWYEETLPQLSPGLTKTKLEKRLAQVPPDAASTTGNAAEHLRPPAAVFPFDEKAAGSLQGRWAKYLRVPVVQVNSLGMRLAIIPPGEFDEGSPKALFDEESRAHAKDRWYMERLPSEARQHRVRITQPFWMGVTEVTQEEYQRVMGNNPSKFQGKPQRPVEQVTWDEAVEFCRRLSELPAEKAARRRYALPTEAQWEFACRAGNPGRWCFSPPSGTVPVSTEMAMLDDFAWHHGNSGSQTQPVGQKRPNAWGLFDVHGNVWEWCQDWFDPEYRNSPTDDPAGPPEGSQHVNRGGAFPDPAWYTRSAHRCNIGPPGRTPTSGFRVLLLVDKPAERPKPGRG